MKQNFLRAVLASLVMIAVVAVSSGISNLAMAASLTSLSDIMTSAKVSTLSDHEIKFVTPSGVGSASQTITITFPGGYTMGTFAVNNVDLASGNSSNCSSATFTEKTIAASAASGVWGAAQSGQVITFTAPTNATTGELGAGNCVRIRIGANAVTGGAGVSQITNPSSANTYALTIAGTFGDTGTITESILTNDQIAVTATVPQTLTFSISTNSIGFGTLSTGASTYANAGGTGSASEIEAHNLIAGTNASTGYTITVQGATLSSGANTIAAIGGTNTAPSAGTAQFGLRINPSGGSGTVTAPYAASGFAYAATASTPSQVASASAPSANTTYSVRYLANISSLTPAGSYSTTLNYEATANF